MASGRQRCCFLEVALAPVHVKPRIKWKEETFWTKLAKNQPFQIHNQFHFIEHFSIDEIDPLAFPPNVRDRCEFQKIEISLSLRSYLSNVAHPCPSVSVFAFNLDFCVCPSLCDR